MSVTTIEENEGARNFGERGGTELRVDHTQLPGKNLHRPERELVARQHVVKGEHAGEGAGHQEDLRQVVHHLARVCDEQIGSHADPHPRGESDESVGVRR